MKIKFKILAGFVLIIAMLLIAGFMSIYEFTRIGKSVNALIDDNYKTIKATKTMVEALEREDSGILLLVSGQWEEGREILQSADSLFYIAFNSARNNITEKNEDKYIMEIEISYLTYKENWMPPIVGTDKEGNITWYFTKIHGNLINTKSGVENLMTLNQDSMYKEASRLKEQAHRAIMPGIVAIISAFIFLVIFIFFINKYFVNPIEDLINSLKNYNSYSQSFSVEISTNDELKELENEIQSLIHRLKTQNKR